MLEKLISLFYSFIIARLIQIVPLFHIHCPISVNLPIIIQTSIWPVDKNKINKKLDVQVLIVQYLVDANERKGVPDLTKMKSDIKNINTISKNMMAEKQHSSPGKM